MANQVEKGSEPCVGSQRPELTPADQGELTDDDLENVAGGGPEQDDQFI